MNTGEKKEDINSLRENLKTLNDFIKNAKRSIQKSWKNAVRIIKRPVRRWNRHNASIRKICNKINLLKSSTNTPKDMIGGAIIWIIIIAVILKACGG